MQLGLSSYTYGWAIGVPGHLPARPMDEHDLLDRARDYGVPRLQICDNLPLNLLPDDRLDRLSRRAAAEGVRLEVGSRRLTPGHVAEMVAAARRLHAHLLRFVIDGPDFHPSPGEVVQTLRDLVPSLDGLRLGIENHDRFPARILRGILEDVGSERVGICLDTANSLGAGEGLATVLAELGPWTVNLHLKDFQITRLPHLMGFAVEGRPAGQGMLDLPSLLDQIKGFGRCESATLELWTPPEATLDATLAKESLWTDQSMQYLKPLFRSTP